MTDMVSFFLPSFCLYDVHCANQLNDKTILFFENFNFYIPVGQTYFKGIQNLKFVLT